MIKLYPPINNFSWKDTTQLFGVNKDYYSRNFGLPAHNGVDMVVYNDPKQGFGTKILATHSGRISKIYFDSSPLNTRGNGIYLISDDGLFETVYWHLSAILKESGKVEQGEPIGLMGNSGKVFPLPNKDWPWSGTHLHFGIKDLSKLGNDYGGFVDPTPWLASLGDKLPIYFARDLYFGRSGDDVSWLQTCLKIEGLAEDYEPIGYFGYKTMRDVKKLQVKYGITPTFGYCGPKTRRLLINRWSVFPWGYASV